MPKPKTTKYSEFVELITEVCDQRIAASPLGALAAKVVALEARVAELEQRDYFKLTAEVEGSEY